MQSTGVCTPGAWCARAVVPAASILDPRTLSPAGQTSTERTEERRGVCMAGLAGDCSHTDRTRQAYCSIESRAGVWTLAIAADRVACCSPQTSLKSAPSPLWLPTHLVCVQAAPAADGAVSAVCHGQNPAAAAKRHAEAGAAAAAALQQAARQSCGSWRS